MKTLIRTHRLVASFIAVLFLIGLGVSITNNSPNSQASYFNVTFAGPGHHFIIHTNAGTLTLGGTITHLAGTEVMFMTNGQGANIIVTNFAKGPLGGGVGGNIGIVG